MVNFDLLKTVDCPTDFINEIGLSNGASYVRLGTRLNAEIRYFPADGVKLPLTTLPPLPVSGGYVIQLFDETYSPVLLEQVVIKITEESIERYCRFHDGCRGRHIPGVEL